MEKNGDISTQWASGTGCCYGQSDEEMMKKVRGARAEIFGRGVRRRKPRIQINASKQRHPRGAAVDEQ